MPLEFKESTSLGTLDPLIAASCSQRRVRAPRCPSAAGTTTVTAREPPPARGYFYYDDYYDGLWHDDYGLLRDAWYYQGYDRRTTIRRDPYYW